MILSRRSLFSAAAATSLAFSGLGKRAFAAVREDPATDPGYVNEVEAYGPLVPDPKGLIDLPQDFAYKVFSTAGETMDDGFHVPGLHDGMASFPHTSPDKVVLVRNHEINPTWHDIGPLGPKGELIDKLDKSRIYDHAANDFPLSGGTTTLVYNIKTQQLESHHLSLTGTVTNCAGGPTPWHSWLSCEENALAAGDGVKKDHGYVFEVPSGYKGLAAPVPIKAMGRFKHEAAAIDPATGIVYMTEDMFDGVFYRYLPNDRRYLHKGGKLQALVIRDAPRATTSNKYSQFWNPAERKAVAWIDLKDVESPDDSLRTQAYLAGAARFSRAEGIYFGRNELFFACTAGGERAFGQIMRYIPSRFEGTADEATEPGHIELFVESKDLRVIDYADNVVVSPRGELFVCEDRYSDVLVNHLKIVTPAGKVATFAANVDKGHSEWAGVCFSPDGSTLFANVQTNGLTVAITGPWERFSDKPILA
ncbi:MAG TPA: alkaline phosphatase PhoX [Asticcacaulis sp.]|nr:alkaline phosphatase PhoX [Asticcacaulis sp.]